MNRVLRISWAKADARPFPSPTADVQQAFAAVLVAQMSAPAADQGTYTDAGDVYSGTVDSGAGTVDYTYTATDDPTVYPHTVDGDVTFTDWPDPFFGYTLNGTASLSVSISDPGTYPVTTTATITCDLTLTGGNISRMVCSLTITTTVSAEGAEPVSTVSGSVTADGHTFSASELLTE